MANPDTRTIKSKTCRQLAEIIKNQFDDDYAELAYAALQEIFNDEQITDKPECMTICNDDEHVIFGLVEFAERLVRAVGNDICDLISRIGDEIAETVEC